MRIDTVCGDLGRQSLCGSFLKFPALIGNLVRSADFHPSSPGGLERDHSFVSRRWPIVVYFAFVGLGARCQLYFWFCGRAAS